MMKRLIALSLCLFSLLALCACGQKTPSTADYEKPDISGKYYAEINVKDYGTIQVELDADAAPVTVDNFIRLVNEGFYDGLTFHRIMEGFMMQGGDGGDTTSDRIIGEFEENGIPNDLSHTRGAISMARTNDKNSAFSQFFIVHEDSTFLDGAYAAFGYVVSGMDVVDRICTESEPVDNNGTIPQDQQPVIESIRMIDEPTA